MASETIGNRMRWTRCGKEAGRPLPVPGAVRPGAAQPQPVDPSFALRSRLDWAGVRSGFLEVFLTLAATIGFGFAWAAVEMARLGPAPESRDVRGGGERAITAAGLETGYPAALGPGR